MGDWKIECSVVVRFCPTIASKMADVPDSFSTLLDAAGNSPNLALNQVAKTKEKVSRCPLNLIERSFKGFRNSVVLLCRRVSSLVKASNILVSKLNQVLQSMIFYTKINPAAHIFKKMESFFSCEIQTWFQQLAIVDDLTKEMKMGLSIP